MTLLDRVETRRKELSESLDEKHRARLGQFFTPSIAADLITGMIELPEQGPLRVLDPGAGVGTLTASLVARVIQERPSLELSLCAIEIDPTLIPHLEQTIDECGELAKSSAVRLTAKVLSDDFVHRMTGWTRDLYNQFDIVVMNPPYRKLAANSAERRSLDALGIDSPNLYSAFLALGPLALQPGGQLVAITPRSFANGPYFSGFRRFLFDQLTLDHIQIFESRSTVFSDSKVLQENVVFSARKWTPRGHVRLSVSHGHTDMATTREVPYTEVFQPGDRQKFIHIPTHEDDTKIAEQIAELPCTLDQTRLQVSTGKVVDFRARPYLLTECQDDCVPLIYPGNIKFGGVEWPRSIGKPQALMVAEKTEKLLLPNERYVLVKRFSAKEERRRVVAAIYEPETFATSAVAFENHLNVFHIHNRGLEKETAKGLCLWLNSTVVDRYFRTFSGHTQVNATDLRSLRYPSRVQLAWLGGATCGVCTDQEDIDGLVQEVVFEHRKP